MTGTGEEQELARPHWRECLFVVRTVLGTSLLVREKVTYLSVELAGLQPWSALVPRRGQSKERESKLWEMVLGKWEAKLVMEMLLLEEAQQGHGDWESVLGLDMEKHGKIVLV